MTIKQGLKAVKVKGYGTDIELRYRFDSKVDPKLKIKLRMPLFFDTQSKGWVSIT